MSMPQDRRCFSAPCRHQVRVTVTKIPLNIENASHLPFSPVRDFLLKLWMVTFRQPAHSLFFTAGHIRLPLHLAKEVRCSCRFAFAP
jgi:hypothetical protein